VLELCTKVPISLAVSLCEPVSRRVVSVLAVGATVARDDIDGLDVAVVEPVGDELGGSTKAILPTSPRNVTEKSVINCIVMVFPVEVHV
jgi:hypothetical protein